MSTDNNKSSQIRSSQNNRIPGRGTTKVVKSIFNDASTRTSGNQSQNNNKKQGK